jgi:hypothetical protein
MQKQKDVMLDLTWREVDPTLLQELVGPLLAATVAATCWQLGWSDGSNRQGPPAWQCCRRLEGCCLHDHAPKAMYLRFTMLDMQREAPAEQELKKEVHVSE